MRLALFHPRGGDRPDRLFEVDFAPFSLPHFARSLKHMGGKLHRKFRNWLARIAFDRSQEPAQLNGISYGGMVIRDRRDQRA